MEKLDAAYAKKRAEDQARAAGLSKKDIKLAGKNAANEYNQNYYQFESAQKAEIEALKKQGLSSNQIKAETKANQKELADFRTSYLNGTAGTVAGQKLIDFRSTASTYSGDVATNVSGLLNTAANKYSEINIAPKTKSSETTIGMGLDSLVKYELGQANKAVNTLIDRGYKYVGNTFTQDQLNADQIKLKEVKDRPGLYQWIKGGDELKNIVYFTKNQDGTYTGSGINRTYTPPKDDDNGFLGLGDIGGALALAAIGYFGGPALAGAFGTSGAVASGIAGGLLGAGVSAATGYDPVKGALTAASGGAFAGGGGFSGLGGTEAATGAFDAGIGLDAMAGGQGLAVPGAATGAFDTGIGLDVMAPPTSPTDYSLLGGAEVPTGAFDAGVGLDVMAPPPPTSTVDYSLLGGSEAPTGAFDSGIGLDVMATPTSPADYSLLGGTEATTGAYDAGIGLDVMAEPPFTSTVDYSLLGGSDVPTTGAGLDLGTGITVDLAPLPAAETIGITPIDYTSIFAPEVIPGVVGGVGLQVPEMPNIGAMGGGQGLTVPVEGGTVGQLGFTPTGATPSLGDPASFINNPDVLGQPVIQQGTPASGISVTDAIRAVNTVNTLLNPPQQQTPTQQIASNQGGINYTGVDYSGLLSLLASRPQTLGLLGTRFNPYSLMG